jgi:pseudouridine-5'-phosphate glycosidase
MEAALAAALAEARARGIAGKAVTPFLLDRVRSATGGQGLTANVALIVANARLAAEVAVKLG